MADAPRVHHHDSADGTVPFEDAFARVLALVHPLSPIALPLTEAFGCVVAEDLVAAVDLPEFASSAMDGFAVRASDVVTATPVSPVELKIVGRALIGRHPDATVGGGEAVRIATGAPIPAGADTIVPIENAEASTDTVRMVAVRRPVGTSVRRARTCIPGRCSCRKAAGWAHRRWGCSRTPATLPRWSTLVPVL
jgi:Molybdopterin biosynthesis enzyme